MQNLVHWACSKEKKNPKNQNTKQTQGTENLLRAKPEQGWPGGAWLVSIHTSPGGSQSLKISGANFICQVSQLGAATASSSTQEGGAGSGMAAPPLTGLGKSWQMNRMGQELAIPNIQDACRWISTVWIVVPP